MSLSFQTNVTALTAETNLQVNSNFQSQTITRLTSGFRINSSGDDAAGLAVANSLRSTISELTQGVRNANDGVSILQTIDGGLNNISNILDQLKSLATQSASGTFAGNRNTLNQEFTTLLGEIDRQAANIGLGTGTGTSAAVQRQPHRLYWRRQHAGQCPGHDRSERQRKRGQFRRSRHRPGFDRHGGACSDRDRGHLGTAVTNLGLTQGRVGTGENDLNYSISLAQSQITNDSAAESRIRDADVAAEAANLTKSQVLEQSSVAALAQANAAPQALLKLLQ